MAETEILPSQKKRKLNLAWLIEILYKPSEVFKQVPAGTEFNWLTPLLAFTCTTLILVLLQGSIRQAAVTSGEIQYPPGFEFYTQEQQAQFIQALQATSSPVFTYLLPGITQLAGIWIGWMIVGGLLHLILTLLGGRGTTSVSLSLVAWASAPFILRDIIRIIYILITDQLIQTPGLAGFVPNSESQLFIYFAQLLSLIDIFLIWHTILLMIGARIATHISKKKAVIGVLTTILFVIAAQALLGYLIGLLSNLSVTRPFFF